MSILKLEKYDFNKTMSDKDKQFIIENYNKKETKIEYLYGSAIVKNPDLDLLKGIIKKQKFEKLDHLCSVLDLFLDLLKDIVENKFLNYEQEIKDVILVSNLRQSGLEKKISQVFENEIVSYVLNNNYNKNKIKLSLSDIMSVENTINNNKKINGLNLWLKNDLIEEISSVEGFAYLNESNLVFSIHNMKYKNINPDEVVNIILEVIKEKKLNKYFTYNFEAYDGNHAQSGRFLSENLLIKIKGGVKDNEDIQNLLKKAFEQLIEIIDINVFSTSKDEKNKYNEKVNSLSEYMKEFKLFDLINLKNDMKIKNKI